MEEEGSFTLARIELFRDLGGVDLEALARRCRWRRYAAGEYIIGEKDNSDAIFFIVDGRVRATVYAASGKEVSFRDLGPGSTIGELSAIDGAPRSATVVALSDALLAAMPAVAFREMLRDHPDISARMLTYLVTLVRKLSDRVVEYSVLAVRNRIHAELLRLVQEQNSGGNVVVLSPPPTHADIAARVATHREAVTRELNALSAAGLLERRPGALAVIDIAALKRLVRDGFEAS